MKYLFFIFLIFLLPPSPAMGQTAEEAIISANAAYSEGMFEEAEKHYKHAISKGLNNGHSFYNLANAQFRQNKLGRAIANYLRAQKTLPRHPDIIANLDLARSKVVEKLSYSPKVDFPVLREVIGVFKEISAYETILILVSLNAVCWICFGLHAVTEWATFRSLFSVFIFATIAWVTMWVTALSTNQPSAVVIKEQASFRSGDSETFQVVFVLHEGAEVKVSNVRKGWIQAKLPGGRVGWVKSQALEIIN